MRLRELILETAGEIEEVGPIEETLKWDEPAYLTSETGSGSTIRIDWKEKSPDQYAIYFNCKTSLVERFKTLAKEGFYNGTTFHRVADYVLQGGDPNGDGTGKSKYPNVPAEFSDVPFEPGMLGAARSTDPNSANCQFYITLKRYPSWDKQYTVFGKVIEGMNNAVTISGVPKNNEIPIDAVRIKSVTIQPR